MCCTLDVHLATVFVTGFLRGTLHLPRIAIRDSMVNAL
jgi:hypothetical protein